MSTITQKIPNLLGGISQQPDVKKLPGQVVDSLNTFPEYALGVMKRPGAKFEAPLRGAVANAQWFTMLQEGQKYVGQFVMDGTHTKIPLIRIWFKESGLPRVVDMTNYLTNISGTFYDNLKTSITTETEELEDYLEEKKDLKTAQGNYLTEWKKTRESFTELFEVETQYNLGSIEQHLKTGVLMDDQEVLFFYLDEKAMSGSLSNGIFTATGDQDGRKFKRGTEVTEEYPMAVGGLTDHRLFKMLEITEATLTQAQLDTWVTTNYDDDESSTTPVQVYEAADTAYDESITNDSDTGTDDRWPTYTNSNDPTNDYFVNDKSSTASFDPKKHLKFFTLDDTTFLLNTHKKVEWSSDKTPLLKFDVALCNFLVLTNGDYTIKLTKLANDTNGKEPHEEGYINTPDTSFGTDGSHTETVTYSTSINTVEKIRDDLNGKFDSDLGDEWDDWTFEASGTVIYVKHDSDQFEIEFTGPTPAATNLIRHEVPNVGSLPVQAVNGYKVKIINSTDIDVDDMWMKFETEDGQERSPGSWVESNRGDWEFKLNKHTMPHVLKVQSDGSFKFEPWDNWEERRVGDEETNPTPSFITETSSGDKYINDIFLYRNRMGFLSDDNVILSRAGHYFDFFTKSAVASADDDPIDISVAPTNPVTLYYTFQVGAGLIIFGQSSQYLLATDSDLLSPKTAKVNGLTGFTTEPTLPAVSLGPSAGFFTKTQGNTKFMQLVGVQRETSPQYIERTKNVPELLPTTIDKVVASPTLSLVSFGEVGKNILYHFNFYQIGDQEVSNTWYRWELPGTLEHHFFDENVYNCVIKSGNNFYVVTFDMAQSSTDGVLELEGSDKKTDVCLDVWYRNPVIRYQAFEGSNNVDRTKVILPFEPLSGKKPAIVIYGDQNTTFRELDVTEDGDDNVVFIDGDWRGFNLVIGYEYTMSIKLPTLYVTATSGESVSSDSTATLILNRLQVQTGMSGPIDYEVKIVGVDDRTQRYTITPAGTYEANSVNIAESGVHTVPIHQRNKNVTITIQGTTPFPATIESLNWEGRYTTNFYRRS